MSFRAKIILALVVMNAIFLTVITGTTLQFFAHNGYERLRAHARTDARLLASAAVTGILTHDVGGLQAVVDEILTNPDIGFVRVLDRSGRVLAQGGARQALARPFHEGTMRRSGRSRYFEVDQPVIVAGVRYGTVELGLSVRPLRHRLAEGRLRMTTVALVELLLALLFAFYFGSYLGRRLKVLEDAASKVGEGQLGYQVMVRGRDEISRTLRAFNAMSLRLREASDERQRQDGALKELAATLERRVAQRTQELADANQALQKLALHDPLTGLPNRALFEQELGRLLMESRRTQECFAVMILDLNGFKAINDSRGHDAGDRLLRAVGQRLQGAVRASDVVARFGGDEFALLLPALRGGGAAIAVIAEKVARAVAQPLALGLENVEISASIGVAVFPEDGVDMLLLIRRADAAMYWAKRHAAGFQVYDPMIDVQAAEPDAMPPHERRIHAAMANGEFLLHYQPIVSLIDGAVVAVEALARWEDPERGLISPADFMPTIERSRLMTEFTLHVLDRALDDRVLWAADHPSLPIAINISALDLQDDGFVQRVRDRLAQAGPARLVFELTEGALVSNPDQAAWVMEALRDAGIPAALDDYGTGYASIAYLRTLPFDRVKIDRSLIAVIDTNVNEREIVRAIIDVCHCLGYGVVAEGVEHDGLQEILRALHCDYAQGYGIARPMPAAALCDWLAWRAPAGARDEVSLE